MRRIIFGLAGAAFTIIILGIGALAFGYRVFVIQPIGAIPDGITVVVRGVPGLRRKSGQLVRSFLSIQRGQQPHAPSPGAGPDRPLSADRSASANRVM